MKAPARPCSFLANCLVLLLRLVALAIPAAATAQPYPVPPSWGGDMLSRARLTGDWGGWRDELGKQGVVLDVDLLLTPQINMSGGRNTGSNFWGNLDYTLNLDTQKMGLWPGGFFKFQGDTGFGSNVFHDAGAAVPVNTAALIPGPNERTTVLMNASYTQFFSPQLAVYAGKINTLDSAGTEFYGDYRTQFMNIGTSFPMTLLQVPISTFGGGAIVIPREDILLSGAVFGPSGTPDSNDIGKTFDGVLLLGEGKVTVKPFGLPGHHSVDFTWNDKRRFSLNQDPSNLASLLLQERFPRLADPGPVLERILAVRFPALLVPAQPPNHSSSSWAMSYSFDQYLWQADGNPHHGIGIFFAFGASDGNPNPIQYSLLTGIGGKGVVAGRPDDSFGLALARTEFSSAFLPFLRQQLNLGLQKEDAIEMYYSWALTPWLNFTTDLQIVNPALTKKLTESGQLVHVDTAVIGGARVRVRF